MKSSAEQENAGILGGLALFMAVKTNGLKTQWLGAQAAVVIGFVLQAGIAAAQNLATNPGFETGNTSGWFAFGSPTISVQTSQVHSGSYAGLVTNRTATYMGIAQSFQGVLQQNQTYTIGVWVRLVSGTSQTMQLTMQKVDGSGTTYSAIASSSVSTSGWTQLSGQYSFNYSGTLSSLTLYAEVPSSSSAAYYIDDLVVQPVSTSTTNGQCTVDWATVFQRIDGFGASSAWDGSWSTSQADMFFSTNNGTGTSFDGKTNFAFTGVGLSLLRNHIAYASSTSASAVPSTVETTVMQWAQARGARVWSTPWTPASGFKSNNGPNGGNYLGSGNNITNLNYASQLANYAVSMKNNYGVNIYALSVQNEPDANITTYEACVWNGTQIHDFVTNLYSALAANGVGSTKIILPESQNWASNPDLWTPTLSDSNAAAAVSIIANHNYVADNVTGDTSTPATLSVGGKTVWETEVSQLGGNYDGSIANAIYWAGRIHLFMTAAQANAWHYWWLVPAGSDNEALTDTNGIPAQRMYALGQFARFVRPDFYRINVATNTSSAQISAYKDSTSSNFAIVAINSGSSNVIQVFNLTNVTGVSAVTPWITSATMSLSNQTPVAVSGSSFTYTLPPLSVVTFVGQGTSSTPSVPTSLMLASGSNPSTYGNTVTFTATVQTNNVALGGISGETVTFYSGATQLSTGTLNSSGQAAYTTTANQLAAGTWSVSAVYGGDPTYAASTNSPALSQTVNQAVVTPGLTGTVSRSYDGTINASLGSGNYTLSGVVSGDTVTLNNPAIGTYDTKNAGAGKTVTVTGLSISGASAANYSLSSTSVSGAVGTISQTNITATATANSKIYDASIVAAAVPIITAGAVQAGDSANFSETYASRNAGANIVLTPAGIVNDGNGGNNYTYTFIASTNGIISAATLSYTADPASMVYGAAVPALSGSVSGFLGGDTQGNATTGTLTFTALATSSSSVGTYAINGSGLTANYGNYTFVQAPGNATALSVLPLMTPVFAGQGITVGAGGYQLSISGQAGQTYQILVTSDLQVPMNQWTVLTNGTFGAGTVAITDGSTNMPQRFYQIISP
jgi:O-glycosyl hydrolase